MKKALRIGAAVLIGAPVALALLALGVIVVLDRPNGTIATAAGERDFLLHVPEGYEGTEPLPLVLSFHGAALWPGAQAATSRWNDLADREGILVAYPAGRGVPRVWLGTEEAVAEDVAFVDQLVDSLQRAYAVDPARVYADGLSNGGRMAWIVSCRLADRVAAVATVGAAQELPWSVCGDAPPVPVLAVHGTADPIVPYGGGDAWIAPVPFPDVREWMARWAERNGCAGPPAEDRVATDVRRAEYPGCSGGASVILYTVEGGGHTWPGARPLPEFVAGRTTSSIDATELIWSFFEGHVLPPERR